MLVNLIHFKVDSSVLFRYERSTGMELLCSAHHFLAIIKFYLFAVPRCAPVEFFPARDFENRKFTIVHGNIVV